MEPVRLLVKPTLIYVDNQRCIFLAKTGVVNKRTKHIDVRFHYTRNALQNNLIDLAYFSSNAMTADILTKALWWVIHESFLGKSGVRILEQLIQQQMGSEGSGNSAVADTERC